jgi:hypothetical protein
VVGDVVEDSREATVGRPEARAGREARIPLQVGRNTIVFTNVRETYAGTDRGGREWLISPARTGWRLEFRDPGDAEPTYAGTHPTVRDAGKAACT